MHKLCTVLTIRLFFFNDTATTEIYTLSLHDALPICAAATARSADCRRAAPGPRVHARPAGRGRGLLPFRPLPVRQDGRAGNIDRKSTRLNSSHANISYAVFCLKKKKTTTL